MVERLVVLGVAELEARASQLPSSTAFLFACENGSVACVEALVEAGCDTTATNDEGCTGLMYAAGNGHAPLVERLLALGLADLETRDSTNGATAFLVACRNGSVACVEALVEAGCDTAATNDTGFTGLMNAVNHSHAAVLERLLALGVADLETHEETKTG